MGARQMRFQYILQVPWPQGFFRLQSRSDAFDLICVCTQIAYVSTLTIPIVGHCSDL